MASQSTLPDYGVSPEDAVALVQKFMSLAQSDLDTIFSAVPSFSANNSEVWLQVVQMMHSAYAQAIQVAQRKVQVGS